MTMSGKPWIPKGSEPKPPPPPVYRCSVCGGKGYTFFEAGPGVPTAQRTCDYCKGSGTDAWVHANHATEERRQGRKTLWWRVGGITYLCLVGLTIKAPFWALTNENTSGWIVPHYLALALAVFVACRLVITSPAWKHWKAHRAQGDGFTSTEEKVLGTGFVVGTAMKFNHDQRVRQQQEYEKQVSDWMKRNPGK